MDMGCIWSDLRCLGSDVGFGSKKTEWVCQMVVVSCLVGVIVSRLFDRCLYGLGSAGFYF